MRRTLPLCFLLGGCVPPGGGGGSGQKPSDARADTTATDLGPVDTEGGVTDGSPPDGPPPLSCEEALGQIRGAVAQSQRCVLSSQCVVVGGPEGCGCGPVAGEPGGYVVHFNQARPALAGYARAQEACLDSVTELCGRQPSMATCSDLGRCELVAGGECAPDAGALMPDAGRTMVMCEQLRQELEAFVESHAECESPDDCAVVGGSTGCGCNLHEGSPEGYGVRRSDAPRAQQFVELLQRSGCSEVESCGVPSAVGRPPLCVDGRCAPGEAPEPCRDE